jgi:hypothetical protein
MVTCQDQQEDLKEPLEVVGREFERMNVLTAKSLDIGSITVQRNKCKLLAITNLSNGASRACPLGSP